MATFSQTDHHPSLRYSLTHMKARVWVVPLGRVLFSLIFVLSGLNHFKYELIAYAQSQGVPFATVLVPFSGALALIGGLFVLFGYYARYGAILLIAFLIPVTFFMHAFWDVTDPMMKQLQMIQFMKNLSMLGGAFLIAFYGAGPVSLDNQRPKRG